MSKASNLAGFVPSIEPTNNLTVGNIIAGVATASSFVGNLTGDATGLSGTPNVIVGVVTATSVSVSGNVSIAGTLTYEDVTNVDSIGIITARSGIQVTSGDVVVGSAVTLSSGGVNVLGIVTASGFVDDGTNLLTEINTKTSTGKAIAMAMIFG